MDLDPEILKSLLETFKAELEEQLQVITDGLLNLEKNNQADNDVEKIIETIFRSAHNIKGAARGIGVKDIGDIAHQIETLFSSLQKKTIKITPDIIDLCLEAVDSMRFSMLAYTQNKPVEFNIQDLLERLQQGKKKPVEPAGTYETKANTHIDKTIDKVNNEKDNNEYESIRVSVENLDRVSALVEEIQVNKIAINDYYTDLAKLNIQTKHLNQSWKQMGYSLDKDVSDTFQKLYHTNTDHILDITRTTQNLHHAMHVRINELTALSDALQDEIRMLRLVPADIFLHSLPRTVRDISHALNKEVELKITGNSVKIDKIVLEGLKDPIMHLLRNAIDHGIESRDARIKNGKSEIGHIHLDINEEGDNISIILSDDGAGIDIDQIAAIAERKNLITQSELINLTSQDILELIFQPGFSTKELITDISGRGIGLDVVKTNLLHLKGQVKVTTELNKGTIFKIEVPLTLASERGLVIRSGGQLFVIPTNLIEHVLLLHTDDIIHIQTTEAILIEQHPVPLRILADIIQIKKHETAKKNQLPVIILRNGPHAVALLVEEIIGEREIVIKPLSAPLAHISCVIGGTLAGNGEVIIVLNPIHIINASLQSSKMGSILLKDEKTEMLTQPHILVVDDSITTRTLEKNILESKNYHVTVAVNGKEAWEILQKQNFSLLITDVAMPIMDGFTLTEKVKQHDKLKDLPVIIVTSLDSDIEKKRGIDVGANAYIVKNEFESDSLLQIVEQLV